MKHFMDYVKDGIPNGYYQHYKGNVYCVIGVATHSETLEKMVVYRSEKGELWVRPASMWNELVDTPNGKVKRFARIEEEGDGE